MRGESRASTCKGEKTLYLCICRLLGRRSGGWRLVFRLFGGVACALLLSAGAAAAQSSQPLTPRDPTAVLPPLPVSQPLDTRAVQSRVAPDVGAAASQFVFRSGHFAGAASVPAALLDAAWAPYVGRTVSLADLRTIASAAEQIYADAGLPFVAILVPPQEVRDGQVEFQVIEGRVTDLTVLGRDPTARRQATRGFQPLLGLQPVPVDRIERAYDLARDIPGLSLAGSLRRGSQAGGMDLVVQAERRDWRFYVNANNFYPEAVGPFGVLLGADYYGGSLHGDQTSVQLYSTTDGEEQRVLRFSHLRRLNSSGTSVSLTLLGADANPQGSVAPLDLATDVFAARGELAQPFIRRGAFELDGAAAFEWTDQKTQVFSSVRLTEDNLRILVARLFGRVGRENGRLFTRYGLELRQGVQVGDASRPGDFALSRFGSDPQATVLRFNLAGEARANDKARLAFRLEGQWSNDSLTAPEEYSVGNLTVGRGYEPGSSYGDRALALSVEGQLGPYRPREWLAVTPYAFADAVKVWNEEPLAPNDRWVRSVGVGLRFDFPDRARLDLFWADPLDAPLGLGESRPQPRVFVNLTVALPDAFAGIGGLLRRGASR